MILQLSRLWVNLLSTGEAISGPSGRGRTQGFSQEVEVRTYASGRRRAISTPGEIGEIPFTLVALDLVTKDKLRGWVGLAVQIRDHRQQKWFGVFNAVSVTEYMRTDLYTASFSLLTTTVTEGV